MENKINKIIATIIWIKSKEKIFLIHILKNQDVEFKQRDRIAKGERRIKTLIII